MADGVDDETWLHHLTRGDYSRWFRDAIRDETLAENVGNIERSVADPVESRRLVRAQIEERYTAPA